MPKLSIIIPVYKTEKYLNRCVDSILNQTFKNFECILVDDGSPDRCPQICDEYAQKDGRIRVIHKQNGGASDAKNVGIKAAKGEYLSFVDSDDWIHPQMMEIMYRVAEAKDAGLVSCDHVKTSIYCLENTVFFDDSIVDVRIYSSEKIFNDFLEDFFWKIYPYVWGKLYKRECFANLLFDTSMKIYEDEYIYPNLIETAKTVAIVNEKLYYYFETENSLIRKKPDERNLLTFKSLQHLADFMNEKKIHNEAYLFEYKWMMAYITLYYEFKNNKSALINELEEYKQQFKKKYIPLLKNPKVTLGYKLLLLLFIMCPYIAKPLYRRLTS